MLDKYHRQSGGLEIVSASKAPITLYEQTFNPSRDESAGTRLFHRNGRVDVPTGPGVGIEIICDILDRYRVA
ncbi:MAG: hypothetical protein M3Q00_04640 [Pseudomonadota bacterium]|nr:hypothetical protein [Pseudomonadota bacterium]